MDIRRIKDKKQRNLNTNTKLKKLVKNKKY